MKRLIVFVLCALLLLSVMCAAAEEDYLIANGKDTIVEGGFSGDGSKAPNGSMINVISCNVTVEGNVVDANPRDDTKVDVDAVYVIGDTKPASFTTSDGDVTSNNTAITLYGENSSVEINGSITAGIDAVTTFNSYNKSLTASVFYDGTRANNVTVTGDITAGDDGLVVYYSTDADVSGDIEVGEDGIAAFSSHVTAHGDIDAGRDGVDGYLSQVTVEGDVTAERMGLGIMVNTLSSTNDQYIIEGTVNGGEIGLGIMNYVPYRIEGVMDYAKNASEIPTIAVGKIESDGELIVTAIVTDADEFSYVINEQETDTALMELVIESLNYIISGDDSVAWETENGKTITSNLTDKTYEVAVEGETIILTPAAAKKGYHLAGVNVGEYAQCIDNGDGTYTVTVMRGGDLVFSAIFKKDKNSGSAKKTAAVKTAAWIITDTAEDGTVILSSTKAFTEEELKDLSALLKMLLTEQEIAQLMTDEDGNPIVVETDEETAEKYFGGRSGHISIFVDVSTAKKLTKV